MKIIKEVGKEITGLDYPMFLCEKDDGTKIYLPKQLINQERYIQISIFDLEG